MDWLEHIQAADSCLLQRHTDIQTPKNWEDTLRDSLGMTWHRNDRLKLRGGVAYDETPVLDNFRTPRIPDSSAFGLRRRPVSTVQTGGCWTSVTSTCLWTTRSSITRRPPAPRPTAAMAAPWTLSAYSTHITSEPFQQLSLSPTLDGVFYVSQFTPH